MKIHCPKCNTEVRAEDMNVATDVAMCRVCNEAFPLSHALNETAAPSIDLNRPLKGAWFTQDGDGFRIGATTRNAMGCFLVPFMCVWSGGSIGGIYGTQIATGKFNLFQSLFGIPFVLGSLLFWSIAMMCVFGKVEVSCSGDDGNVFTGVGKIGWRKYFKWSEINSIYEDISSSANRSNSAISKMIVLEGAQRITFGSGLNDNRRYFMVHALKAILAARKR